MQLIYPGPSPSVTLASCDLECLAGVPVEVPDVLAASLVEQGWTVPAKAEPVAKKSTSRKAANTPKEG